MHCIATYIDVYTVTYVYHMCLWYCDIAMAHIYFLVSYKDEVFKNGCHLCDFHNV